MQNGYFVYTLDVLIPGYDAIYFYLNFSTKHRLCIQVRMFDPRTTVTAYGQVDGRCTWAFNNHQAPRPSNQALCMPTVLMVRSLVWPLTSWGFITETNAYKLSDERVDWTVMERPGRRRSIAIADWFMESSAGTGSTTLLD